MSRFQFGSYTNTFSHEHSSPTCDLQSFYENFNPESNEDCMFATHCSESKEVHPWKETFDSKSTVAQDRFKQISLAPAQPADTFIDFYNWKSPNIEVSIAKKVEISRPSYTNCHQIKKTIAKKKRIRTTFTTEQIIAMEQIFKTRPYICREDRLRLTQRIQVNERSIKVWFQNRRRMSEKRDKDLPHSPSSVDSSDSYSDRLTHIESLINDRTDQFGNVRLDDEVVSELVSVIDYHLSRETKALFNSDDTRSHRDSDLLTNPLETCNQNNIIMYEPISPFSVLDEFI